MDIRLPRRRPELDLPPAKKEARCRRCRRFIVAAAILQSLFALFNVLQGALSGQMEQLLLPGLTALALAVLFARLLHPLFGILGTALYLLYRLLELSVLLLLPQQGPQYSAPGLAIHTAVALGAITLFVYADYQAVVLKRLTES